MIISSQGTLRKTGSRRIMRSPVASLLAKLFTPVEKHQLLLLSVVTIIIAVLLLNVANTFETVPFFELLEEQTGSISHRVIISLAISVISFAR